MSLADKEDIEERKLLFAQGIQVYLIQNRLAFFSKSNLICETRVQKAFEEFSRQLRTLDVEEAILDLRRLEEARSKKCFRRRSCRERITKRIFELEGKSKKESKEKSKLEEQYDKSFAGITDLISFNLINDEWLIRLLRSIEFSSKVAASVPPTDDENQAFGNSEIAAMPEHILNAIAKSLDKSVREIKEKDLGKVKSLDLSYLKLENIPDIRVLEKLPNLIHLYLSGNKINDISTLEKLSNLTDLYLSGNRI